MGMAHLLESARLGHDSFNKAMLAELENQR
jgi:hypothetical protein